ncbi:hypothetical protein AB0J72_26860 [Dactylosporangium sp. NPDC049742]|uniref:hypothetical protein n=1 Tax=Dactylosporangium sp. NPDC049742 TaxID=3154737 RepID=UPI00341BC305
MTVDELIRVFAAQRPDLDWVRAVQPFLPALRREHMTALLAALPRADRRTRVELVRVVAPHLDRAQVAEVAEVVATTKGAEARLAALGLLADRLPGEQRDDAVSAAVRRAVKVPAEADDLVARGGSPDAGLLCCCAPHLGTAQLDRALDLVSDPRFDFIAGGEELLALRPHLSPAQRSRAARDLVARTVRTRGALDHRSVAALAALAGDLTDAQVDTVVGTAPLPYESHHRAWLTTAVLPRLTAAQAARALEHALAIPDPDWRTPLLGDLFPRLDADGRDRVIASTHTIVGPAERVAAVASYIGHLPTAAQDAHLAAALTFAGAVAEPYRRAIALAHLAAAVPAPARDHPLRLAFTTALSVDRRDRRLRALTAVGAAITGIDPEALVVRPPDPDRHPVVHELTRPERAHSDRPERGVRPGGGRRRRRASSPAGCPR